MTFSLKVRGLDEIADVYESMLESVIASDSPEATAGKFSDMLEARTPVGFTGKLKKSVLVEKIDDATYAAGYSIGVERPGEPLLDAKKKTGRSVLWATQDELADVFDDVLASFNGDSVLVAGLKEDVK